MNEMNEYSNEHLLNGFVDGELDTVQEETLFEQLSINSELRSQLHDLRAIRTTARNYAVALVPPASLTQETFAKLGFNYPVPTGMMTGTPTLLSTSMIQLFKKYWLPIISIIFSSLLTTIIILSLSKDSSSSISSSATQSASPQKSDESNSVNTQSQSDNTQAPQTQSNDIHQQKTIAQTQINRSINSVPPSRRVDYATTNNAVIADTIVSSTNEVAPNLLDLQNYAAIEQTQNVIPSIEIGQKTFDRNLFFIPSLPPNFSIEYRTLASRSYPDATIGSKSDPWFNNMSIGLFYSFNDNHMVGIEVGQETFPQHYSGTENGKSVRYEQNLLTQWIVATYRYRFYDFDFLGRIDPFISMGIGGTVQAWTLGRSTIGINYSPEQHISFMIGADGSMLFYPFQSKWFTTKKIGLTYGISFSF